MICEVAEETGCEAAVERLLGVDSRTIPASESRSERAKLDATDVQLADLAHLLELVADVNAEDDVDA